MQTVQESKTLHMMYVEAIDEAEAMKQTAISAMGLFKHAEAERDELRLALAAERGDPEGAPSAGWFPCGGVLREFRKVYPDGTEAQVYAEGSWWRGYRGILPSWNQQGRRARTLAEGPTGLKRDAMKAADRAVGAV